MGFSQQGRTECFVTAGLTNKGTQSAITVGFSNGTERRVTVGFSQQGRTECFVTAGLANKDTQSVVLHRV